MGEPALTGRTRTKLGYWDQLGELGLARRTRTNWGKLTGTTGTDWENWNQLWNWYELRGLGPTGRTGTNWGN